MSVSKDAFDFESIHYPAFIVVAGGSKHTISSHNRSEWEEHFASDVCQDAAAARRLMDGYRGWPRDLAIYAVPLPAQVIRLELDGNTVEYDANPWPDEAVVEEGT